MKNTVASIIAIGAFACSAGSAEAHKVACNSGNSHYRDLPRIRAGNIMVNKHLLPGAPGARCRVENNGYDLVLYIRGGYHEFYQIVRAHDHGGYGISRVRVRNL